MKTHHIKTIFYHLPPIRDLAVANSRLILAGFVPVQCGPLAGHLARAGPLAFALVRLGRHLGAVWRIARRRVLRTASRRAWSRSLSVSAFGVMLLTLCSSSRRRPAPRPWKSSSPASTTAPRPSSVRERFAVRKGAMSSVARELAALEGIARGGRSFPPAIAWNFTSPPTMRRAARKRCAEYIEARSGEPVGDAFVRRLGAGKRAPSFPRRLRARLDGARRDGDPRPGEESVPGRARRRRRPRAT